MSSVHSIPSTPVQIQVQAPSLKLSTLQKGILVALTCLFALGMVFSYVFGAQWFVTVILFAATLVPLFPLGRISAINKLSSDNIK